MIEITYEVRENEEEVLLDTEDRDKAMSLYNKLQEEARFIDLVLIEREDEHYTDGDKSDFVTKYYEEEVIESNY